MSTIKRNQRTKDWLAVNFEKYFKYFRSTEENVKEWQGLETQGMEGINYIVNVSERLPLIESNSLGVLSKFHDIKGLMMRNHYDQIENILKSLRQIL